VIRLRPLEIFILAILSVPSRAQDHEAVEYARRYAVGQKSMSVENGYVPDRATAIRIAVAVLIPIYGPAIEKKEAPWNAELKGDIWTVVGAFHGKGVGGEAIVQLRKSNGTVTFITHDVTLGDLLRKSGGRNRSIHSSLFTSSPATDHTFAGIRSGSVVYCRSPWESAVSRSHNTDPTTWIEFQPNNIPTSSMSV